jgi:hypothetical protein
MAYEAASGRELVPHERATTSPGQEFGRSKWRCVSWPFYLPRNRGSRQQWATFECECGTSRDLRCASVVSGATKSCGCNKGEGKRKGSLLCDGNKRCSTCQRTKTELDFCKHQTTKDGLAPNCKSCQANIKYKSCYGISLQELEERTSKQGGLCACCGVKMTSRNTGEKACRCVDHCHMTGAVRGIICKACNTGIGLLGDSVNGLSRAIAYLQQAVTSEGVAG